MYALIIFCVLILLYIFRCPCNCKCGWLFICRYNSCNCCCAGSENFIIVNKHRQVTLHYTEWCPSCIAIKPVWNALKQEIGANGIIKFTEIDEDIAKTPDIMSYPTIRMTLESGKVVEYHSQPSLLSLKKWILAPSFASYYT